MLDPAHAWRRSWQEDLTLGTDLRIYSVDDHSSYCSKHPNRVTLQDVDQNNFCPDYLFLSVIVNVNEPWREKAIEVLGMQCPENEGWLPIASATKAEPASRLRILIFTPWRYPVNRRRYRNNADTHRDAPPDQPAAIPQFLFLEVVLLTTWSHCTQCKVVAESASKIILNTNKLMTGKKILCSHLQIIPAWSPWFSRQTNVGATAPADPELRSLLLSTSYYYYYCYCYY